MEYKDYYKILGLERGATQDDVKRAFRKLARKFHPDVSKEPTAEARFKEISEAYEVLSDAEKRAAYDQLGKEWRAGQEFRPPPDWDAGFEFSGAAFERGEFSDFFDALFGGMRRRERPFRREARFRARGEDHHARILIDLRDTFTGATRPISLRVPEVDDTGHVVLRDRILNVQIPKGVTEGQHVRLKGQGAPGVGGMPAGDLYLEVNFRPDPLISCGRPRPLSRASRRSLGGSIRRKRENADADGADPAQDPGGVFPRQTAAGQGPRHTRRRARRSLCHP
jgi:curved DNA-binding protein